MDIRSTIRNSILILDGAMGTQLQHILKIGENPETLNISNPQAVKDVHTAYLRAGANMILSNTFGAVNCETIDAGVRIAKEAASEYNAFAALDIGPLGEIMEPVGTLKFEQAYDIFKDKVLAGVKAGADTIYIETMTDLYEAKCAVLAAKENCDLPVFCTMSFEQNLRTFMGTDIPSMALTLKGLGVDCIGINCSVGPKEIYKMTEELIKWTDLPVIIKPNAGMPSVVDGKTVYNSTADEFADDMSKILELGVTVIGGCCGTEPSFIQKLSSLTENRTVTEREKIEISAVCSSSKTVVIDRVRIVGERINPTGKKRFQKALRENDMDYITAQAIEQSEADILDVNAGLPDIDEKSAMVNIIKNLQSVSAAPLQIDSSNAGVIEAGLRVYCGKAIINSINGDDGVLSSILPLAKKYGAAVIGLTMDKNGIPKTAESRLKIAERIVSAAADAGISKNDIFIDCLTLTAGAEQETAYETLDTLRLIKERLGVKTILGVSNISFGLPARDTLNQFFLSLALANGLDLAIINPNIKSMVDTVYCFHQLKNIDRGSHEYIKRFSGSLQQSELIRAEDLPYCIENGLKESVKPSVENLLKTHGGLDIINGMLIPALDAVGARYERGEIFLPQLLQSAEAAKAAFEVIKTKFPEQDVKKHKIILATVEGDIHDIGKNIVKVVLENYGYDIIDLGRDAEISAVADAAVKNGVKLVGLSALMTTTVENMRKTIEAVKARDESISVMVGGAVLNEVYAKEIKADYYAKDALAAVAIADEVFR